MCAISGMHNSEVMNFVLGNVSQFQDNGPEGIEFLQCATFCGRTDMIDFFLDYGANINETYEEAFRSSNPYTEASVLHQAIRYNQVAVVKQLLAYNADIDIRDSDGLTSLQLAQKKARFGNREARPHPRVA